MHINGRIVLITGASQGIGAACAEAFRAKGARLALTARSEDKLKQIAGPQDLIVAGDLTDPGTRSTIVERTLERFGAVDLLINNAGVGLYAPSWQADLAAFRAMHELNVMAPLAMIQLVAPHMRKRHSGSIVNVGSIAGKITLPWFTLYSATKYALGSITTGLRMELQRDGIHVMLVCPGYVKTGFQSHVLAGRPSERLARSRKFAISAGQCAQKIVRGVERNARTVVTPAAGWLLIGMQRLFPALIEAQMLKIYHSTEPAG